MRKLLIAAALAAFAFASAANAATQCKDPKTGKFIKCPPAASAPAATGASTAGAKPAATRCKDPKTGKFIKCAPPAAAPAAAGASTTGASTSGATPKHCVKGKPCGNTCIKATDVCHKT